MSNLERVSIIVPIYNVDLYLEQCIKSLINQTYKNIEIILINDGSTDSSLDICNRFKDMDNRIIVINQLNFGVSVARNNGLKLSNGKYIMFVDADDFVENDYIEKMVLAIESADMAICSYKECYKNSIVDKSLNRDEIIDNILAINKMFGRENFGGYLWNKIFKNEIIKKNNIQFQTNIYMCEDMLFVIKYLLKCKNVKLISNKLYNYRMRKSSMVWNQNSQKYETIFLAYNEIYKLLKENNINLEYLKYTILNSIYSNGIEIKNVKQYFDISKFYHQIILSKNFSLKKKVDLYIKKNFNILYSKYMNRKVKKFERFE